VRQDKIAIAGAGRVAQAMGKALQDAGIEIHFLASRNPEHARIAAEFIGSAVAPVSYTELAAKASHVLIAVSDSVIETTAKELSSPGTAIRVALHTSGSYGPELLEPLSRAGVSCGAIHPLQTISSGTQGAASLRGAAFAVSGSPEAMAWANRIAHALGGKTLYVKPEARHLYHAAAVMTSNYIAALLDTAQELMIIAGIGEEDALLALAPLARTSLENAIHDGPVPALTGPIVRGDASTIAAHILALAQVDASARRLYRAAGIRALRMARKRGLGEDDAAAVHRALLSDGQIEKLSE
jgi:predicted short-subunit dehydrogenase-like oxidoreductase (DUF2520 family)